MSYSADAGTTVKQQPSRQWNKLASTDEAVSHVEEHKKVQKAVHDANQYTADIRKEIFQLNVPSNSSSQSKMKVQDKVDAANSALQQAEELLKEIAPSSRGVEHNHRIFTHQKLTESLLQCRRALEAARQDYEKAEEAFLAKAAARQSNDAARRRTSSNGLELESMRQPLTADYDAEAARVGDLCELDVSEAEVQLHTDMVTSFAQQVVSVEESVRSIQRTMVDLAEHAAQQGEVLDNIESNVSRAADTSTGATTQLTIATQRQNVSNKRILMILAVAFILASVVIVILVTRKK